MRNSRGFAILEGLLILIIVGILAGTGWYVWNSHQKTNDILNKADQVNNSTPKYTKKSTKSPYVNWKTYSSVKGVYSLKYPPTWIMAAHPELCSEGLLLLGPDNQSAGTCGSENFGQVSVVSVAGDKRSDYDLSTGYKDVTKTSVTVDGVKGQGWAALASGQHNEAGIGVLADGTKVVESVFYTKGRTYVTKYVQTPQNKDVLSDFVLMSASLKFSS